MAKRIPLRLVGAGGGSYRPSTVIIKRHNGPANVDEQGLPTDDSAVVAVHVLSHYIQHHISIVAL